MDGQKFTLFDLADQISLSLYERNERDYQKFGRMLNERYQEIGYKKPKAKEFPNVIRYWKKHVTKTQKRYNDGTESANDSRVISIQRRFDVTFCRERGSVNAGEDNASLGATSRGGGSFGTVRGSRGGSSTFGENNQDSNSSIFGRGVGSGGGGNFGSGEGGAFGSSRGNFGSGESGAFGSSRGNYGGGQGRRGGSFSYGDNNQDGSNAFISLRGGGSGALFGHGRGGGNFGTTANGDDNQDSRGRRTSSSSGATLGDFGNSQESSGAIGGSGGSRGGLGRSSEGDNQENTGFTSSRGRGSSSFGRGTFGNNDGNQEGSGFGRGRGGHDGGGAFGQTGDNQENTGRDGFGGGLFLQFTKDDLQSFYSQFGTITDCAVMNDPTTRRPRGFGFVAFTAMDEVEKAMNARPFIIQEKTIDPKRVVPRKASQKNEANISTKRLYVSGVRDDHTEIILEDYFSKFGSVKKVEIIKDKATGKYRGFAFISFDDSDPVDKCCLERQHMILNHRCDVRKALSKEEIAKAQQMDRDRAQRGNRSRGNDRSSGEWNERGGRNNGGGRDSLGGNSGGGRYGHQSGGYDAPQQQPWQNSYGGYGGYVQFAGGNGGWYGAPPAPAAAWQQPGSSIPPTGAAPTPGAWQGYGGPSPPQQTWENPPGPQSGTGGWGSVKKESNC